MEQRIGLAAAGLFQVDAGCIALQANTAGFPASPATTICPAQHGMQHGVPAAFPPLPVFIWRPTMKPFNWAAARIAI
jgi:hypothetical protein